MTHLFNTPENGLFKGIKSDLTLAKAQSQPQSLNKAKKGTPEYEEWLRKYREKRGAKAKDPEAGEKAKTVLKHKDAMSELKGKSNAEKNRILSKEFSPNIKLTDVKNFRKKGDSYIISSNNGLGDMKITLLEDISDTEEMKRNALPGSVYDIEHIRCRFEYGGKTWDGTIAHHENWNPDYEPENHLQFFERDKNPWLKEMRSVVDGD